MSLGPDDLVNDLDDVIHELRREVESQRAVINYQATQLAVATEHHDRVIARLLDGWVPYLDDELKPHWFHRERRAATLPLQDVFGPMSDGEAAIIRAHQEKNA